MLEECVGGSGEPVEEGHCIEGEGEERARERARERERRGGRERQGGREREGGREEGEGGRQGGREWEGGREGGRGWEAGREGEGARRLPLRPSLLAHFPPKRQRPPVYNSRRF